MGKCFDIFYIGFFFPNLKYKSCNWVLFVRSSKLGWFQNKVIFFFAFSSCQRITHIIFPTINEVTRTRQIWFCVPQKGSLWAALGRKSLERWTALKALLFCVAHHICTYVCCYGGNFAMLICSIDLFSWLPGLDLTFIARHTLRVLPVLQPKTRTRAQKSTCLHCSARLFCCASFLVVCMIALM